MGGCTYYLKSIFVLLAIQARIIVGQSSSPAQGIFLNISYGNDPQQTIDVYLPAGRNATATKVILLIHGGGWSAGQKEDMNWLVPYFNYIFPQHAIVNMNYRLATIQSPAYPKQLIDIYMVLQFLGSKAAEYSFNPSYAFVGVSAGAHLAMLYGYGFDAAKEVRVICDFVGPSNLVDPAYTGNRAFDPYFENVVGNYTFAQNPWLYYVVSPVAYINSSSPKTISFYGDQDPLIPVSQGETLEDKLDSVGVYNKYYLYPGAGHMNFTAQQYAHTFKKIMYFFNNYL